MAMLTESREAIRLRKPEQILVIASLSLPQFGAKAISAGSGNVPGFEGFSCLAARGGDGARTADMGICGIFESSSFDDLP
jgi:hypothetical protein